MRPHAQNMNIYQHVPFVLWFIFVLFCGWVIFKTDFRTDLSVFLPPELSREEAIVVGQLQNGAANRILLVGIEGADTATLAKLGKIFAGKLRGNPAFAHVHNGQNIIDPAERELLYNYRYLLSPNTTAELFTPEGLQAALQRNLLELSSASGLISKSLFMRDPTGEVLALMDRLVLASSSQSIEGQWFNDNGTRALLLVQLTSTGTDINAQEAALQYMQDNFAEVTQSFKNQNIRDVQGIEDVRILISGPASFAVSSHNLIKEEAFRLAGLGILLIATILLYMLRSPKLLIVGLLPIATGVVAGIATVSLGFGSVHAMTIGFGSTLTGEAIDYSIYYFLQRSQISGNSVNNTIFWRTIGLGMLTSICGFSAMLFSGFTGLAQLGVFSIAGLLVAAACTRWVLPSLLPIQLHIRNLNPLGARLQQFIKDFHNWRSLLWLLALSALLLLLIRQDNLWNYELEGLSPIPKVLQDLDGELRVDMGAADVRHMLVLQAQTAEQVLQRCEQFLPRLNALVTQGLLQAYQAPCIYLPSQAMQKQRQLILPTQTQLEQTLQETSHKLPVSVQSLHGFIEDVAKSKILPLLQPTALDKSSLGIALGVTLYPLKLGDVSVHHALIQLQAPLQEGKAGSINQQALQAELSDILDEHTILLDLKDSFNNIYKTYLNKMLMYSAVGFTAIVVLLMVALRSLQKTLQVVFPLVCTMLFTVTILHLLGVQLNLLNIVGLLLVFAVGSNYSLFFSSPQSNATLASLFLANITTMTGFGILAFSQIPVLQAIGITVGPGVFLALILSALMAPATAKKTAHLSEQS